MLQYAATVALNYEEIKNNLQRIKSFINKYYWEGLNFPSKKKKKKKKKKRKIM